jgi:hypothetical protein
VDAAGDNDDTRFGLHVRIVVSRSIVKVGLGLDLRHPHRETFDNDMCVEGLQDVL